MGNETFKPRLKKNKKSTPKKFLIFQEMELSSYLIFSQKKAFIIFLEMERFYISGYGNLKVSYISEINFASSKK